MIELRDQRPKCPSNDLKLTATAGRHSSHGHVDACYNATMKVSVLAVVAIILCGCRHDDGVKQFNTKGIGHLKWTISGEDGTTISQGERDVVHGEVQTETVGDSATGGITKMTIPLSDHFQLGLTSAKDDSTGFGLTASHQDQMLFSWEWFTVDGNKATKLQESGALSLEMSGRQIGKVTFDTDVSLRLIEMDNSADISKPKFRILIAKGSTLSMLR